MRDLLALKLYTRVARLGSFSAAARELGLSQSQASRIISDLEAELGSRLLSRTTRAVVPNDAGADYLARIEPILDALDEADQSIRGGSELRGVLRVGMPTSFALRDVIPRLPAFTDKHPHVQLQIIMEDKRQDLVREAVDVHFHDSPIKPRPAILIKEGKGHQPLTRRDERFTPDNYVVVP